jgi:glycine betaine/proline transport system substrate-binding protein
LIIEEGYGHPVEMVPTTTQEWKNALPEGRIDLDMEGWQHMYLDWYDEETAKGTIVNLGMTYESGAEFYMIPKWVAEEYSIQSVFDMKDHWELFQDPDDPSKGIFHNCLLQWECSEVNKVKLEAALARPQDRNQPVFGYYWAPNALMGLYEWHILEEPAYTEECWREVAAASEDESLRPIDQACAFFTIQIDKLVHKGLLKKAPDVEEMLRKMVVGLEPLNDTLAWASENDVQDWEGAAIYYLRTYEDRWRKWVTQEAFEKIKEALEEASE